MARDSDGYADAGGPDHLRRHPRGRFVAGDVDWRPRLLHVPHRPTGPERGRVHSDRPQAERTVPCEPSVAGGILHRDRGRDARRIPAAEPGRLRHSGTHPSAPPRRHPHIGRMLVGRRAVRLRNLLGPEDGPGALRMATDVQLKSQPQRGRVLPAWAYIGWRWVWRSPAAAIVPLLQPFFFLYFLHVIAPPEYFPLQVAGAMLFSTQNIGSWCLSDSAVFRIEFRLQDIFVASPHSKLHYLFGVAFSNLIPATPAIIVLGIILASVTHVSLTGWLVLIGSILTIWLLYSAIGIAVSSRLRSQREVWPVGNLIFTLLGILSPLYYPISILPPVWREVARLLPATYAGLLLPGVPGPGGPANLAAAEGFLALSTAVGLVAAWWLYEWRER